MMWYVWYRKHSKVWQHKQFRLYESAHVCQFILDAFGYETILKQGALD